MRKLIFIAALLCGQAAQATCNTSNCPTPNIAAAKSYTVQTTKVAKPRTANPIDYANLISVFNASYHNTLLIPQLGVPNATGGFDVFAVLLQLSNVNPVQFQLIEIQPVAAPVNALSAVFSIPDQMLFVPILAADFGGGSTPIPIFELVMKVSSLAPFTMTEYLPLQPSAPTSPQTSPAMNDPSTYQMLSNISRMSHDTNMSILANMDGTSCYGYDYQCR